MAITLETKCGQDNYAQLVNQGTVVPEGELKDFGLDPTAARRINEIIKKAGLDLGTTTPADLEAKRKAWNTAEEAHKALGAGSRAFEFAKGLVKVVAVAFVTLTAIAVAMTIAIPGAPLTIPLVAFMTQSTVMGFAGGALAGLMVYIGKLGMDEHNRSDEAALGFGANAAKFFGFSNFGAAFGTTAKANESAKVALENAVEDMSKQVKLLQHPTHYQTAVDMLNSEYNMLAHAQAQQGSVVGADDAERKAVAARVKMIGEKMESVRKDNDALRKLHDEKYMDGGYMAGYVVAPVGYQAYVPAQQPVPYHQPAPFQQPAYQPQPAPFQQPAYQPQPAPFQQPVYYQQPVQPQFMNGQISMDGQRFVDANGQWYQLTVQ